MKAPSLKDKLYQIQDNHRFESIGPTGGYQKVREFRFNKFWELWCIADSAIKFNEELLEIINEQRQINIREVGSKASRRSGSSGS